MPRAPLLVYQPRPTPYAGGAGNRMHRALDERSPCSTQYNAWPGGLPGHACRPQLPGVVTTQTIGWKVWKVSVAPSLVLGSSLG